MIGDKRLDMPETNVDAVRILNNFDMPYSGPIENISKYAKKLVEMNNEVYEKMQELTETKDSYKEAYHSLKNIYYGHVE